MINYKDIAEKLRFAQERAYLRETKRDRLLVELRILPDQNNRTLERLAERNDRQKMKVKRSKPKDQTLTAGQIGSEIVRNRYKKQDRREQCARRKTEITVREEQVAVTVGQGEGISLSDCEAL